MSALINKDEDSDLEEEVPPLAEPEEAKAAEAEVDTTLANSDNNTKHVEAAKIANLGLQEEADLGSLDC